MATRTACVAFATTTVFLIGLVLLPQRSSNSLPAADTRDAEAARRGERDLATQNRG